MTQDEIIEMVNKASKEWLKELPTPEETANQVPKRFLEIFAKLVAAKEREACAKIADELFADVSEYSAPDCAAAIRARGQA
jgi:DNA phosphorothioation-dependent restriction protein DptG